MSVANENQKLNEALEGRQLAREWVAAWILVRHRGRSRTFAACPSATAIVPDAL